VYVVVLCKLKAAQKEKSVGFNCTSCLIQNMRMTISTNFKVQFPYVWP
jgi:hypothetical protein